MSVQFSDLFPYAHYTDEELRKSILSQLKNMENVKLEIRVCPVYPPESLWEREKAVGIRLAGLLRERERRKIVGTIVPLGVEGSERDGGV